MVIRTAVLHWTVSEQRRGLKEDVLPATITGTHLEHLYRGRTNCAHDRGHTLEGNPP